MTSDSEELHTLELDLQTVVGCYVVSGTQTQDFCKNKCSSLQPHTQISVNFFTMFNQVISAYGELKFILGLYGIRAILKTVKINQVKPAVWLVLITPEELKANLG